MAGAECRGARWRWRLTWAAAVGMVALAVHGFWGAYAESGLFRKLGADYALYHAQAVTLRTGGPSAMYDAAAVRTTLEGLLRQTNPRAKAGTGPVPYPPLFSWLFSPLTTLDLAQGFVVWTGLNVFAAIYLGARCARILGHPHRLLVMLLVLGTYPVTLTLYLGQIQVWLACAVAEAYGALRRTAYVRAGLWLGLLTVKPQYLFLLVPLLLWFRQGRILGGMALCAAGIWLGSLLTVGVEAVRAYPRAVHPMLSFRGDWPQAMINWRGLLLTLDPEIDAQIGMALTVLLGVLTGVPALWVWRSGWHVDRPDFSAKLLLLFIATMLIAHQSHGYGAAILAPPMLALWATPYATATVRTVVLLGAYVPTLILATQIPFWIIDARLFARIPPATFLTTLALIGCYLTLLHILRREQSRPTAASP